MTILVPKARHGVKHDQVCDREAAVERQQKRGHLRIPEHVPRTSIETAPEPKAMSTTL